MALPLFCTWLPHNWTVGILTLGLLTYYRFALVCSLVNTEKRAFSVSWASWNQQKCPKIVLNLLKIWSWNFTSCSWEPCQCLLWQHWVMFQSSLLLLYLNFHFAVTDNPRNFAMRIIRSCVLYSRFYGSCVKFVVLFYILNTADLPVICSCAQHGWLCQL